MQIENDLPLDPEIDEIQLNKNILKSLDKLTLYEDGLNKDFKNLGKRMKNATSELKSYLENQNQVVRLYIQLLNRNSDLINNHDLQLLKAHVKKIELRIQIQEQMSSSILDLSSNYREYAKSLAELTKSTNNLLKAQENWQDASSNYYKVKHDPRVTGTKLEKIEKKVAKEKKVVIKRYEERRHKNSFLKQTIQHISEAWIKFKNSINRFEW